ncbi:MAG: hypothetical protein IJW32_06065 [Clostridia bacterium]|nr:hypothetical protein [Alphaproteobacteria bacterium]MBQ9792568.1 hypothetical protein [Clostridia bacterium]MBQ9793280.1 hypothetical protein [Clostridia bacterium]
MLTNKEIDAMNIAFDFSNPFAIARVPLNFKDAETFALDFVYSLGPYVADKLDIGYSDVVLIAISKNNKVVVYSVNSRYRDWLYHYFQKPSLMYVQFYDDIEPELIIEKIKELYK